jgi:hypothetical protein
MQDICIYCDICYSGNVSGSSKNICLNCLEHIVDKSIYGDIDPLKNYDIIYNKNKIICEMCNQSRSLFVTVPLCTKHNKQLEYLYDYYKEDDNYWPEDCYDYEENDKCFGEIKTEIIQMLEKSKNSKLTYKVSQTKDERFDFEHSRYIFIYQGNYVICKFIYDDRRLALIFDNKIYATSNFYAEFREMYFSKLNCKLLEMNEILDVFKNHFKITYCQTKNFDDYIKPINLQFALIDRFNILNDPLIEYQYNWCKCNNCDDYNHVIKFTYDSVEILRIIYSDSILSVWTQNNAYTNYKNECLHFNSKPTEFAHHSDIQITKYLNFDMGSNIQYKSHLEIYKLMINYPSRFREKRTWSDITKSNI